MDPWRKETLGLEVGEFIIWQDVAIEVQGQPAFVAPRHAWRGALAA